MVSLNVPKRRRPKFGQLAREFTANSSLHGVKYIGEQGSSLLEKIAWSVLFATGASFAIYMCFNYWSKWNDSPVITSFDSTTVSLKDVPFPALTICNNNKISRSRLEKLMQNPRYAGINYEDMRLALRIMNKVDLALPGKLGPRIPSIAEALESKRVTMDELMFLMRETLTPCHEILIDCTWQDKPIPCSSIFVGRATNDGFCCSFNAFNVQGFLNYVDENAWINYLDRYTSALAKNDTLPNPPPPINFQNLTIHYTNATLKNTNSAGIFAGLSVILNAKIDDYNGTTSNVNGFRFLLHDSDDFPDVGDRGFLSGADSEINIGVEGILVTADPAVRGVDFSKRQCYMEDEYPLHYFDRYSASNCLMECLTDEMMQRYNCRPYFYPVPYSLPMCPLANLTAIAKLLTEVRADQDIYCPKCAPTCNAIHFKPFFSYAHFPGQAFSSSMLLKRLVASNPGYSAMHQNGTFIQYVSENMIPINLYYQEKTGMRYKMQLRYSWEDFVSALGGLMGLGIGFSLISCMEVLYFLCFRYCLERSHRTRPGSSSSLALEAHPSSTLLSASKDHPSAAAMFVKLESEQQHRRRRQACDLAVPAAPHDLPADNFHYVAPVPLLGFTIQSIQLPLALYQQRQDHLFHRHHNIH